MGARGNQFGTGKRGQSYRIVVAYDVPSLTLLAIRHMRTGAYMPHSEVELIAARPGVSVARSFGSVEDVKSFWNDARALEGVEGYVIAFENGHRIKIKADAYVLRHKALSGLEHEKNLLAWIATDAVDDVLPLLSPDTADFVREYQGNILDSVGKWESEISDFVTRYADLSRKDFALRAKDMVPSHLQSVAFRALDGKSTRESLMEVLERGSGSDTKVETIRPLFNMKWTPFLT